MPNPNKIPSDIIFGSVPSFWSKNFPLRAKSTTIKALSKIQFMIRRSSLFMDESNYTPELMERQGSEESLPALH